jgi:hypothetical protein
MCRGGQQGTTLISLLIGMVVSMLAILASLSMFHSLLLTSAEAKTDARQEGDLSLAVLRLETELQAAGFNMNRAAAAGRNLDFVAVPQAAAGRSDLAWRFNDGTRFICRRAISRLDANGRYTLDLFDAQASANCATILLSASSVALDANWAFTERLVDITLQNFNAQAAGTPTFTQPLILFESLAANDRPCMPFGAVAPVAAGGTAPKHPVLNLGVFDVATVNDANSTATTAPSRPHTLCLANIFL